MRIPQQCFTLLCVLAPLGASSLSSQASVTEGATLGAVKLTDQRSEQAVTGIVTVRTRAWLSLSATPSYVHVSDVASGRSVSSSGLGDLPLSAVATYEVPTARSPVVAAALTVVLPTGNAACGLGSGTSSLGLDVGAGMSPRSDLHLSMDASRSVSGLSAQSALTAPHATSLRADAGYDLSPAWRAGVSLGADVGTSDSTQALSRVLGASVSHTIAGVLALTVDGGVGLSTGSPKWALSVGFGTAFAGTSPVGLSSSLQRLKSTFGGGVNRGSGSGKIGCR